MIRVERHPLGPRVFLFGRRLHHALAGLVLFGAGLVLLWHDRRDWRVAIPDFLAAPLNERTK